MRCGECHGGSGFYPLVHNYTKADMNMTKQYFRLQEREMITVDYQDKEYIQEGKKCNSRISSLNDHAPKSERGFYSSGGRPYVL